MKRIVFALIFVLVAFPILYSANLKITIINVGQGDSILLETPAGKRVLIDAGDTFAFPAIKTELRKLGVKNIDVLIATHPHEDHIGSMDQVLKNYPVGRVFMTKAVDPTETFQSLLQAVKDKKLKIEIAQAGVILDVDPAIQADFLGPVSEEEANLNNMSAVLLIHYGKTTFLLMGDAEKEEEKQILASGRDIRADVMKAGHHGSSTSTTRAFLKAVQPSTVLISVGKNNKFKHPSREVINRLDTAGIDVYRTDRNGAITIESDGNTIHITKEK